jgi:UDP-3-O-[3-hydroxymyristoyl] glucosamine N-acyltransferase
LLFCSYEEYSKWNNGGGTFHKSACIDPTVLIEIGAVVHSKAVLGPNVHVGSGTVVGPEVTIGHSTKIGYNALSLCKKGSSWNFYYAINFVGLYIYI